MDQEMLEQFQLLFSAIEEIRSETKNEIQASEARTRVFIENSVSKRIDALFDGYKLTHEKQWELERETEKLKAQVESMQSRLDALEKKISA